MWGVLPMLADFSCFWCIWWQSFAVCHNVVGIAFDGRVLMHIVAIALDG